MYEDAILAIMDSSPSSSIYVGADSTRFKKNGQCYARYSTVIILHHDSNRGCRIFSNSEVLPDYGNLKQRLLNEVRYAVEAASAIIDYVEDRNFEIHLDLNPDPKHKSHVAVSEALGWVKGATGVDATIKPDSFASSHCADHVVRNKLTEKYLATK